MFRLGFIRAVRPLFRSSMGRSFADLPDFEELKMPLLSPTMTTGTIVKWLKQEGEVVKAGEVMFEVETDKATLGYEPQDETVLAKILEPAGASSLPVGHPIAILVDDVDNVSAFASYEAKPTESKSPAPEKPKEEVKETVKETTAQSQPPASTSTKTTPPRDTDKVFISPLAKKMSVDNNLDYTRIQGSGPGGRIVKEDVLKALAAPPAPAVSTSAPAPSPDKPFYDVPHSTVRKVIASRLLESKQTIPHYYVAIECSMDKLAEFRKTLNSISPVKISVNHIVIKAAALACLKVPQVNSSWTAESMKTFNYVDMSVAVQTDKGLITPIVKNAHSLRIGEIAVEMGELVEHAKAGTLKPDQFQGGSFTISNLGMFGVKHFSAIINPPQSCILAVGGAYSKVIKKGDEFVESSNMTVTLSADHRGVDGAVGAQWLQAFKGYIEEPLSMLV